MLSASAWVLFKVTLCQKVGIYSENIIIKKQGVHTGVGPSTLTTLVLFH